MPALSKTYKNLRYRVFYGLLLRRAELVTLCAPGSICPWTICPTGLNARSIVVSAGVGSDISFEHGLVERFGCRVLLCDPSPTGQRTMALPQNQRPEFRFLPVALAGQCGQIKLAPPLDPEGDSWFADPAAQDGVTVRCTDLETLMRENRYDHIDLLKLDIEGCEYEVIEHLLRRRLAVYQLCVEFHHGILPGIRRRQTISTMLRLIAHGYRLVNQTGANHTFIRPR
jgi:FkbM family methyltransferase